MSAACAAVFKAVLAIVLDHFCCVFVALAAECGCRPVFVVIRHFVRFVAVAVKDFLKLVAVLKRNLHALSIHI